MSSPSASPILGLGYILKFQGSILWVTGEGLGIGREERGLDILCMDPSGQGRWLGPPSPQPALILQDAIGTFSCPHVLRINPPSQWKLSPIVTLSSLLSSSLPPSPHPLPPLLSPLYLPLFFYFLQFFLLHLFLLHLPFILLSSSPNSLYLFTLSPYLFVAFLPGPDSS